MGQEDGAGIVMGSGIAGRTEAEEDEEEEVRRLFVSASGSVAEMRQGIG